uniref:DUF1725 domain-containing protein n=1 Tax=Sus scrofa TaxID=9823 RepID=A0A8D1S9D3_PIG
MLLWLWRRPCGYSSDSTPSLGTSICRGSGPRNTKKRKKYICISIFIAVLSTIAKRRKQPKCPSADEWIKKMWCIYTMEYHSAIKTNKIMQFAATWTQLEILILSEVSQKENTI